MYVDVATMHLVDLRFAGAHLGIVYVDKQAFAVDFDPSRGGVGQVVLLEVICEQCKTRMERCVNPKVRKFVEDHRVAESLGLMIYKSSAFCGVKQEKLRDFPSIGQKSCGLFATNGLCSLRRMRGWAGSWSE